MADVKEAAWAEEIAQGIWIRKVVATAMPPLLWMRTSVCESWGSSCLTRQALKIRLHRKQRYRQEWRLRPIMSGRGPSETFICLGGTTPASGLQIEAELS